MATQEAATPEVPAQPGLQIPTECAMRRALYFHPALAGGAHFDVAPHAYQSDATRLCVCINTLHQVRILMRLSQICWLRPISVDHSQPTKVNVIVCEHAMIAICWSSACRPCVASCSGVQHQRQQLSHVS